MFQAPSRLPCLDVLRAAAVLLVIGHHIPFPAEAHPVLRAWHRGGWIGVDLFFVLSGFLVSGLLFREHRQHGSVRVGRFLVRRGLKIYPAFYCFLAATLTVLVVRHGFPAARGVWGEVLFLQNYLGGVWNHTWSLAVEEHFYLAIAVLAAVCGRRRTADPFRGMAVALACLAGVVLAARVGNLAFPYTSHTHLYPTHLRADALGFGVLLSYAYHFHHDRFVLLLRPLRSVLLPAGLACLVPAFLWDLGRTPGLHSFGLSLLYLGWGAVLVALVLSRAPVSLPLRAIGQVGAHSYSIYLWHMPVIVWAMPATENVLGIAFGPLARVAFVVSGSVAVGYFAARLVEIPVLRLRDRYFPSRSGASAAPAPPDALPGPWPEAQTLPAAGRLAG